MRIEVFSSIETRFGSEEAQFEFDYTPAQKGSRGDYGKPMEPDSPAEMEFLGAYDDDGKEMDPDRLEIDRARELAFEKIEPPEPDLDDLED